MTDDLVTWLREQVAETERIAHEARKFGPVWSADPSGYVRFYDEDDAHLYSVEWPERAAHIALHDPAAVLAQCEAHRAIVDAWDEWSKVAQHSHNPARQEQAEVYRREFAPILRALALAYRHRDGYRSEWKP